MKTIFIQTLTSFLLASGMFFISNGLHSQSFSGSTYGVSDIEVSSGTSLTISSTGTAVINCGSSLWNCENNLGTLLITAAAGSGEII